jgi:hypothetical protein
LNTSNNHTDPILDYNIEEMAKGNPKRTVELLISLLQSSSQANTLYALDKLTQFFDDDMINSQYLLEVYAEIESNQELVDTLLLLLTNNESKVRQGAVIILSRYDEERTFPYLARALEDESLNVRASALSGFIHSKFIWPGAGPVIAHLLNDEDPVIFMWAKKAMGKYNIVEAEVDISDHE